MLQESWPAFHSTAHNNLILYTHVGTHACTSFRQIKLRNNVAHVFFVAYGCTHAIKQSYHTKHAPTSKLVTSADSINHQAHMAQHANISSRTHTLLLKSYMW